MSNNSQFMMNTNDKTTTDAVVERLQQWMQKEGHNLNTFAKKTGVSYQTLANVMDKRNKPGFDIIVKIVTACEGMTADWLMMGISPKKTQGDTRMLDIIDNQAKALNRLTRQLYGDTNESKLPTQ